MSLARFAPVIGLGWAGCVHAPAPAPARVYGKKDYSWAIDAYDQVQLNHPASEKVPAALLKKGYAYLALKDRKKAASALKQVIDLYPRFPEANKAMDKLNQLKESH